MRKQNSQILISNTSKQGKGKDKTAKLKAYIAQSKYIDCKEQPQVCKQFGLHYMPELFRNEYRTRFFNYLLEHTTTCATVTKETGIPQKYLTECKAYYENKGLLKVLYLGKCPTTGSSEVQYLSTNKSTWIAYENNTPKQLNLFPYAT